MGESQDFNQQVIGEFRANGGKVGGPFEGESLLLLHTVGAKTGVKRVSPLAYVTDGERVAVAASNGGGDRHPAWFHNILAEPKVTVEIGDDRRQAIAHARERGDERDRLWNAIVAKTPAFADYERATDRLIPMVVLELTD